MTRLTEQQTAALSSTMSDASVGLVLGRSVGWVARMRHNKAPVEPVVVPPTPAAAPMAAPLPAPTPTSPRPATPTAAQVSAALSAAARRADVDPSEIAQPQARKARTLAGAGLRARFGTSNILLAQLVGVHAPELSPSMVSRAGITTFDLLAISEAIAGVEPGEEEATPLVIEPRTAAVSHGAPETQSVVAKRPRVAKPREVSVPTAQIVETAGAVAVAAVRQPVARLPDNLPVFARAVAIPPRRRASPAPRAPERAAPTAISRLKAVTPPVARWASWFAAAHWDLEEVADLFGVHPDALVDAVAARTHASLPA